jgi:integrase/recombinase XerD
MLNKFRTRAIGLRGYQSSALSSHIDGYLCWMMDRGYSRVTLHGYLGHLRAFAGFQKAKRIKLADLDNSHVAHFQHWYKKSYSGPFPRRKSHPKSIGKGQSAAINSLLTYLRVKGLVPERKSADADLTILHEYFQFLRVHRGLSEATIYNLRKVAKKFHSWLAAHSLDYMSMSGKDVEDFILACENPNTPTVRQQVVGFLKGFLRYLRTKQIIGDGCRPFLPNRRHYKHAALPTVLTEAQIEATIKGVDRATANGKRAYAILLILKTYGLRGGELARLQIKDINWRSQIIHVKQTKTRRSLDLPLVPAVSRAIIDYLRRGRPKKTKVRALFVGTMAPYDPITTSGIAQVVSRSFDCANVKSAKRGSHIFRHSRATNLLRSGKSLKTIGDILGHRNPNSTFWYCKLAVSDLRQVALELPGGAQ